MVPKLSKLYLEGIKKRQELERYIENQYPLMQYYKPFKNRKLYELFDREWDYYISMRDKSILEFIRGKGYQLQYLYYKEFAMFLSQINQAVDHIKRTKKVPKASIDVRRYYHINPQIKSRRLCN